MFHRESGTCHLGTARLPEPGDLTEYVYMAPAGMAGKKAIPFWLSII
jgi:hypothetical protein